MWISNLSEPELPEVYELTNFNTDPALKQFVSFTLFPPQAKRGWSSEAKTG